MDNAVSTKRAMIPEEHKYAYYQSPQISMQTGFIGYLRADLGSTGKEFYSSWNDFCEELKTDEFKAEFNTIINNPSDLTVVNFGRSCIFLCPLNHTS